MTRNRIAVALVLATAALMLDLWLRAPISVAIVCTGVVVAAWRSLYRYGLIAQALADARRKAELRARLDRAGERIEAAMMEEAIQQAEGEARH